MNIRILVCKHGTEIHCVLLDFMGVFVLSFICNTNKNTGKKEKEKLKTKQSKTECDENKLVWQHWIQKQVTQRLEPIAMELEVLQKIASEIEKKYFKLFSFL